MSCEKKWLNQSRFHLGRGLGWAQGGMFYMGGVHISTTWPIEPSTCGGDAALLVKLL